MRMAIRRMAIPILTSGLLFGAVAYGADTTRTDPTRRATISLDDAQPIDYREECEKEGCAREEVAELYHSFVEECMPHNEGCWAEEAYELSGGGRDLSNAYNPAGKVDDMLRAFDTQLGLPIIPQPYIVPGNTGSILDWLIAQADGKVIKGPKTDF